MKIGIKGPKGTTDCFRCCCNRDVVWVDAIGPDRRSGLPDKRTYVIQHVNFPVEHGCCDHFGWEEWDKIL